MKTQIIKTTMLFLGLTGLIVFSGCQKDHCHPEENPPVETAQSIELKEAYNLTKSHNDSLEMHFEGTSSNTKQMLAHHETQYHYFDSLMTNMHNNCHGQMMDGNSSGMTAGSQDGGMMSGNKGEMMECACMGENTDCHALMEQMHQDHAKYHPQ